jgi:hypothetical protein
MAIVADRNAAAGIVAELAKNVIESVKEGEQHQPFSGRFFVSLAEAGNAPLVREAIQRAFRSAELKGYSVESFVHGPTPGTVSGINVLAPGYSLGFPIIP